jgi:hypothetical protein
VFTGTAAVLPAFTDVFHPWFVAVLVALVLAFMLGFRTATARTSSGFIIIAPPRSRRERRHTSRQDRGSIQTLNLSGRN